ncbi:MAG: ribose 5-phosphate isomerase A [Thermoplasmatota archaeon]
MIVQKKNAGRRAAEYVEDGMVIGLGTGSTAQHAIERIGERIREENLDIMAVPTSEATETQAKSLNIPLTSLDEHNILDLTIDGADEVDPNLNIIKGGGGALLREKIVAYHSEKEIIVVDPSKMVEKLGVDFALPVEIVTFCPNAVIRSVEELGCTANLRMHQSEIFITDNHNYILDCKFDEIEYPYKLSQELNGIPGVVENGLFVNMADKIIIGKEEGFEEISKD